ncbi:type VI secretion system-associated lipoprotein [Cellvibrio mixtus]|uniref:Type VI secretion system-associated lipoprotein n=1 Tax=Cellvibrio mixtus TaxID=39650 RepID=A0A266QC84_9GAMM|nr:type VI secretion system lipoprotein TssJ [Cellvibrio mixtus]OZY87498.1 type VI secretion system-associated lipoprotein [Cellvibrio mixtus]
MHHSLRLFSSLVISLSRVMALIALLGMSVFIAGCSSSKSRVGGVLNLDTDLKLMFETASDINPDENSRPSPVFVRFYQLKSATAFDKADFIDIYERDAEIFGGDIVSKQVLKPLLPGVGRTERFVLEPGTKIIALYAEFSQYPGSTYKVTFPVTENNIIKNKVTVKITDRTIALVKK